jgi:hypothetical protein
VVAVVLLLLQNQLDQQEAATEEQLQVVLAEVVPKHITLALASQLVHLVVEVALAEAAEAAEAADFLQTNLVALCEAVRVALVAVDKF